MNVIQFDAPFVVAARPDARLLVDASQGWTFEQLKALAPAFADLGVQMIEQPLPRGGDAVLERYRAPLPLCADESCLLGFLCDFCDVDGPLLLRRDQLPGIVYRGGRVEPFGPEVWG